MPDCHPERRAKGLLASMEMLRSAFSMTCLVVLLASCGGAASAPSAAAAKQPLKLTLGLASKPAPALPNSVLWLAKDLGFYEREGLDVTLQELDGTPTVIAAMLSGDLDVGNISTDQALKLAAQKSVDLRAIHSPDARQYF